MANYQCDGVSVEIPNDIIPVIKQWIDKRDSAIADRDKQIQSLSKRDALEIEVGEESYSVPKEMEDSKMVADMKKKCDELTAMKAKCDALQAENDGLKSQPRVDSASLTNRRKLERQSLPYLKKADSNFKEDAFDVLSDRQIKEMVVSASLPSLKDTLSNRTDSAIDAMFDVAIQSEVPRADSSDPLKKALDGLQSQSQQDGLSYLKGIENAYNWIEK